MGRTDTASLVIEAPVARVFAALIDPHALVEWLPPSGMTGRFEHFDARAGGSYDPDVYGRTCRGRKDR